MRNLLLPFLLLFIFLSCAGGANVNASNPEDAPTIEMPEIPSSLTEPSDRADYLIGHYWDKLDFCDTVRSHDVPLMEQSFVNFLSILPYASSESVIEEGFSTLLERAHADSQTYKMVTNFSEDYLYDPNSPMYSEDLYIIFLKGMSGASFLTEAQRAREADRLEMVSKNRPGTKATDFSFETTDGRKLSLLKSLPTAGNKLMLIFFDPDCENCEEVLSRLRADESFISSVADGSMKVLAVYSGDNRASWLRKAATLPAEWTVGINSGDIDEEELYYLPSMPTIYILDSDGVVVQKDVRI